MKINTEYSNTITFDKLKQGAVFKFGDYYYMRIEIAYIGEDKSYERNCVDINTGYLDYLEGTLKVFLFPNATLNLMGE